MSDFPDADGPDALQFGKRKDKPSTVKRVAKGEAPRAEPPVSHEPAPQQQLPPFDPLAEDEEAEAVVHDPEDNYDDEIVRHTAERAPERMRQRAAPRLEDQRVDARDHRLPAEMRGLRRRRRDTDPMHIDTRIIPPGWCYEWKAETVWGKAMAGHMNNLMENHWRPVPADRHKGQIVKYEGQMLMERPLYLTREAQNEDFQIALDQVRGVRSYVEATPDGQFTRDHRSVRNTMKIRRTYEAGPLPTE